MISKGHRAGKLKEVRLKKSEEVFSRPACHLISKSTKWVTMTKTWSHRTTEVNGHISKALFFAQSSSFPGSAMGFILYIRTSLEEEYTPSCAATWIGFRSPLLPAQKPCPSSHYARKVVLSHCLVCASSL